MTPRKRLKANRGLEPNLYSNKVGGAVYYKYKRPTDGKWFAMGTNKASANAAAKQLNARYMDGQDIVAKVTGSGSVKSVVKRFKESEVDSDPKMAASTKQTKTYRLNAISKGLGHFAICSIDTKCVAEFLTGFKGDAYRQHRSVLKQVFNYAITQGLITLNPVTPTKARLKGIEKQRPRLTIEQFKSIRAIAPAWFKVAMDLALILCAGRNEVAALKFSDEKNGRIRYIRKKTQKHDTARVSAEITPVLREVLSRAKALPPLSPHVVAKPGHGPVSTDMLSKRFNKLAKAVLDLPILPTFHEIRALGSHLLESVEHRDIKDIQSLMAHSDDKQTKVYTDGHGEKWVETKAGNTKLW